MQCKKYMCRSKSKLMLFGVRNTKIKPNIAHHLLYDKDTKDSQLNMIYPVNFPIELEAFKRAVLNEKPCVKIWQIFTENEVAFFNQIKSKCERKKIIDKKVKEFFGSPESLLGKLIYSVLMYCKNNSFNTKKSVALMTIVCRVHQYYLHYNWLTPDELYAVFKEYLFYHAIDLPPDRIKTFTIYDCKKIMKYFCRIYIRNMPLIRLLMFLNFAMVLNYEMPEQETLVEPSSKKKK